MLKLPQDARPAEKEFRNGDGHTPHFTFVLDHSAPAGNAIPALARLLLRLSRDERGRLCRYPSSGG